MMSRIRLVILTVLIVIAAWQYSDSLLRVFNHLWYGHLNKGSTATELKADTPRGLVTTITFDSKLLGGKRTAYVYLPAGYSHSEVHSYPTLYMLHGFSGQPQDFLIDAGFAELLDGLIAGQVLPPTIVVFPDGNGEKAKDSQYLNATVINQPFESHITNELVPLIDATYDTATVSAMRAIGGISAGGYGAVNILLHRPDLFSIGISHGGYFESNDPASKKLIGNDQAAYAFNSPLLFLPDAALPPGLHFYLEVGENDPKFLPSNIAFDALLTSMNLDHEFHREKGWHTWGTWRGSFKQSLTWLGRIWGNI